MDGTGSMLCELAERVKNKRVTSLDREVHATAGQEAGATTRELAERMDD